MTWSIGSHAPSGADLLQGLGEWLAFSENEGGRYSDPDLEPAIRAGEIDAKALQGLRKIMLARIDDNEGLDNYLASFMSSFRLAHEPVSPPDSISTENLLLEMKNGAQLLRNPWTRLTWVKNFNGARLYAAGQAFDCSIWLAEALCQWEQPEINADSLDKPTLDTLASLINKGHFLLTTER